MKKLIAVVTITVLSILACKKKEESPTPIAKKYEYKRTPGEVSHIEGDIFVDTGGTVFTVKGKGFDPNRRRYYHLLLERYCSSIRPTFDLNGYPTYFKYVDTARLEQITDSTIRYRFMNKNVFTVRDAVGVESNCNIKDTVKVSFAVTSKDSTNIKSIATKFDLLQSKDIRNKLFFNIIKDTIIWHKKETYRMDEVAITLDDVVPAGGYGDLVSLYLNDKLINTANISDYSGMRLLENSTLIGDSYFVFDTFFYKDNLSLGLINGEYLITMKEKKTGLPIEERRGRTKIYVKFVD